MHADLEISHDGPHTNLIINHDTGSHTAILTDGGPEHTYAFPEGSSPKKLTAKVVGGKIQLGLSS